MSELVGTGEMTSCKPLTAIEEEEASTCCTDAYLDTGEKIQIVGAERDTFSGEENRQGTEIKQEGKDPKSGEGISEQCRAGVGHVSVKQGS